MVSKRSIENLTPASKRPAEERAALGRKGGKIRAANAKRERLLKDLAKQFLNCPADKATREKIAQMFPDIEPEDVTNGLVEIVQLHRRVVQKGDPRAFVVLRDTAGEKPVDDINVTGDVTAPLGLSINFVSQKGGDD